MRGVGEGVGGGVGVEEERTPVVAEARRGAVHGAAVVHGDGPRRGLDVDRARRGEGGDVGGGERARPLAPVIVLVEEGAPMAAGDEAERAVVEAGVLEVDPES